MTESCLKTTQEELWKPVSEGYYEVSSLGRVRRCLPGVNTNVGRILAPWKDEFGYLRITFHISGSSKSHSIHGLVAKAFLGEKPIGLEINHRDGNKRNNLPSNLEYVTKGENLRHAYSLGLRSGCGEKNSSAKVTRLEVDEIKRLYSERVLTQNQIASNYGISQSTVSLIVRSKRWRKN